MRQERSWTSNVLLRIVICLKVDLSTVKIYYVKQLPTETDNFLCDVDPDVLRGLEQVSILPTNALLP